MAGIAVTALGNALGWADATKDDVQKMLQTGQLSGDQLAAVKKAELVLKQHESDNGFKFAELEIRDRESARQMQIANKSWTPEILSWLIVVVTLGLEGAVLIYGVPAQAPELLVGRILGTLEGAFMTVIAFWLGTSRSSQNKDATIAAQASK
jgi:hypothetical protein